MVCCGTDAYFMLPHGNESIISAFATGIQKLYVSANIVRIIKLRRMKCVELLMGEVRDV
jgi:hypothetical protein